MGSKRPKPEEIVSKLRQVEVLQGQGMSIADAVRQIGVTQQTYYRWQKRTRPVKALYRRCGMLVTLHWQRNAMA